MSNNDKKKLKKVKKGMSPEAKRNLALTFKSLLSNQACVDGAKEAPWWIGVIFLVLGVCLPVIPTVVTMQKSYGASFVDTYNYGADRGLANTALQYKNENYEFKVVDQKLSFYKDGAAYEIPEGQNFNTETTYHYVVKDDIVNGVYNFRLYITSEVDIAKGNRPLTNFVNAIAADKYLEGTTTPWIDAYADGGKNPYVPSYAVIAPDTIAVVLMKNGEATVATSSLSGLSWENTENCELLARVFEGVNTAELATSKEALNTVWNHWVEIFNETYKAQKARTTRNTSLLYLGIYVILVFFLGLMVFLLTRGKNNPFRYIKFFTSLKIGWWACFTPGLLALILGFMLGTSNVIGQMGFIVLASVRIMWLSMRQLRPM